MSYYKTEVGEVIIKKEFRKDLGRLYEEKYDEIENEVIKEWILPYLPAWWLPPKKWDHRVYKDEWEGKYKTTYNENNGVFVYGVAYNANGFYGLSMRDFFWKILPMIVEKIISQDRYDEGYDTD